jgi:hypothetical protein
MGTEFGDGKRERKKFLSPTAFSFFCSLEHPVLVLWREAWQLIMALFKKAQVMFSSCDR